MTFKYLTKGVMRAALDCARRDYLYGVKVFMCCAISSGRGGRSWEARAEFVELLQDRGIDAGGEWLRTEADIAAGVTREEANLRRIAFMEALMEELPA
jgi:hypothetical protein